MGGWTPTKEGQSLFGWLPMVLWGFIRYIESAMRFSRNVIAERQRNVAARPLARLSSAAGVYPQLLLANK